MYSFVPIEIWGVLSRTKSNQVQDRPYSDFLFYGIRSDPLVPDLF